MNNKWNCLAKGALRIQDLYLNWHVSWFNNHTVCIVIQSCWFPGYISQFQNAKYKKQWQTTMSLLWKTKVRTTDVTPMTCPFLWTTNICTGLIYKKCNKIMSHRYLKKVLYTKCNTTNTIKNNYLCCNITYYVMYMSLT